MEPTATTGVMIVGILDGTPAIAAGLLPEDIVLRVGEHAIASIVDVVDALAAVAPGRSVQVVVRRADQERALRLTPAR
jgi:S1-C subfamily serine protease